MKFGMLKVLALALLLPIAAMAQQKTLYVARVIATDSLKAEVAKDERALQLGRLIESLDSQLISEIVSTRKYRMLERSSAMEAFLIEQSLTEGGMVAKKGAQMNMLTGADYGVVVVIDGYQQVIDVGVFNGTHRAKAVYSVSVQMRIVDASTLEIADVSNVLHELKDIADISGSSNRKFGRFDALLPKLARETAVKSVKELMGATFPPTVIDVDEDYLTINAGEDTFKVGDVCAVFGKNRTVTDPDTGRVTKVKGREIGTVTIVEVEADYAQGEFTAKGKKGATVGCQVRVKSK